MWLPPWINLGDFIFAICDILSKNTYFKFIREDFFSHLSALSNSRQNKDLTNKKCFSIYYWSISILVSRIRHISCDNETDTLYGPNVSLYPSLTCLYSHLINQTNLGWGNRCYNCSEVGHLRKDCPKDSETQSKGKTALVWVCNLDKLCYTLYSNIKLYLNL